jgi:hypothetical protein
VALFELTDLAALMQQDLDTATAERARADATAIVEQVTGPVESRTSVVNLPVYVDGTIELPAVPVTGITSVGIDESAQDFVWYRPYPTLRIKDYSAPSDPDEWTYAEVTFTHGYPVVPPLVTAIALQVAARCYTLPTAPAPGVTVQIDDYRESTSAAAGGDAGVGVTLTAQERRALESLSMTTAAVTGP